MAEEQDVNSMGGVDLSALIANAPTLDSVKEEASGEEAAPTTSPPAGGTAEPPAAGAKGEVSTPPAGSSQPQAVPAAQPPAASPELLAAQAQVRQLLQQNAELVAKAPAAQPAAPAAATPAAQQGPRFNLSVPPQIATAMFGDDPQHQGAAVHALVNGTANAIWEEVQKDISALRESLRAEFQQTARSTVSEHTNVQSIRADFYGTHKDLDNPVFYPVVQNITKELAPLYQAQGWTPAYRDAIAKTAKERLAAAGFTFQAAAPVAAAPAPAPAKPKANAGDPKKTGFATGKSGAGGAVNGAKSPFLDSLGM